jgi:hypothetical protein
VERTEAADFSQPFRFSASGITSVVLTTLLFLILLPPWLPGLPAAGLDPSWVMVISHAFNAKWQFGKDIIFTYGPYGFAYAGFFDPENYGVMIVIWVLLALVLSASVIVLTQHLHPIQQSFVIASLLISSRIEQRDTVFFVAALSFAMVFFQANGVARKYLLTCLLGICVLSGLIKFTFALLAISVILLIEIYRVSQRQYIPRYLLSYLALSLVLFVMAGQQAGNFDDYVRTSFTVAAGYSEAMQVFGSSSELGVFLTVMASFLVLVWYGERKLGKWRRANLEGPILLLASTVFCFLAFKAGFVRHDAHSLISWASLGCATALYSARLFRFRPSAGVRHCMVLLNVITLVVAVYLQGKFFEKSLPQLANEHFSTGFSQRIQSLQDLLLGRGFDNFSSAQAAGIGQIRENNPLPTPLSGGVDIYPWDAGLMLAHHFDYRPRPVFQSFAAYTPSLIEANRAHLHANQAPFQIFFSLKSIDYRFFPMEDGKSWLDIIQLYRPVNVYGENLLLHRRITPQSTQMSRLVSVKEKAFSKAVEVPENMELVWATIDIDRKTLGKLATLLFKPPVISITLTMADGTHRTHRLVPNVAREGFLLSPVIDSVSEFSELMEGHLRITPQKQVVAIQLSGTQGVRKAYRGSVRFTFQELVVGSTRATSAIKNPGATEAPM